MQVLFKKSEMASINSLIVQVLGNEKCTVRTYKALLKIFMAVIVQKSPDYLPLATALIFRLRSFMNKKNGFYLGVMLWCIIKAVGIIYDIPSLSHFVDRSMEENFNVEPVHSFIVNPEVFREVMKNEKSVFSKNIKPEKHLTKDMFEIEDMVVEGRRSDLVGDEDEDFIGKNNSDTEFSSVSSYDIQERIIDLQDIKPDFPSSDYQKIISMQEEQDKKLLEKITDLSV